MDSAPLWTGMVVCALAAALALTPLARRARVAAGAVALALAPVLLAADNWNGAQLLDLRDHPALAAGLLALALAVVAALALLLVRRPRWLLPLLVLALPFRIPVDLGGSSVNLLLPLYAVIAGAVVAALLRARGEAEPDPGRQAGLARAVGLLLALVLVLYALQAGYADDLSKALENLCFFLVPFAALYALLSTRPPGRAELRAGLITMVAVALLVAVVGFGQYLTGELFWNQKVIDGNEAHAYFRVNSLFYDPNIMGRYLVVTMVLLGGVVAWGRRREARLALAVFAVLALSLLTTVSQTSSLALLAGALVLALGRWGLARAALAAGVTALLVAVAVLALGGGGLTAETTGRTGLVSGGVEIAEDAPSIGQGSGSFAREFERRYGAGDGIALESHTEPVTIAAEQGAVGLLAYGALLITVVAGLWLAAGEGAGPARDPLLATLLAALVTMVVHSLGYAAFFTDPITWVLLGLATGLLARSPAGAPAPRAGRRLPPADPEPGSHPAATPAG